MFIVVKLRRGPKFSSYDLKIIGFYKVAIWRLKCFLTLRFEGLNVSWSYDLKLNVPKINEGLKVYLICEVTISNGSWTCALKVEMF